MTVAELIAELKKLPPDIPVKVEGYAPDTANCVGAGAVFAPQFVEGHTNEITGEIAVIWAMIETG